MKKAPFKSVEQFQKILAMGFCKWAVGIRKALIVNKDGTVSVRGAQEKRQENRQERRENRQEQEKQGEKREQEQEQTKEQEQEETKQEQEAQETENEAETLRKKEEMICKKLYREIVKLAHPDNCGHNLFVKEMVYAKTLAERHATGDSAILLSIYENILKATTKQEIVA